MHDTLIGTQLGLAIGANLGGNGTAIASLAVLMWRQILLKNHLYVNNWRFIKRGFMVTPLLVAVAVLCLIAEI